MTRLYSLGYVDTMFLGMRPWTRLTALHMLQESQQEILKDNNPEAVNILDAMLKELERRRNARPHRRRWSTGCSQDIRG